MTLLWADGFDHYGLTEGNLLDGVYADYSGSLNNTYAATGTHSFHPGGDDSGGFGGLRKVLPATTDKLGITLRVYYVTLPNDSRSVTVDFLTSSPNHSHIRCIVNPQGAVEFWRGGVSTFSSINNGTLIATSDPVVTAAGWHHLEIQVYIHDTDGWIRMAVNGIHEFEATGLDTKYDSSSVPSVGFHQWFTSDHPFYIDDLILYDFTGDSAVETDFCPVTDVNGKATTYIGELQCRYLPPDGNTAEDDWDKSTGSSAFALVDEVDPDDTDYISSDTAGDLTELDLTDLPPEITYIRGCVFLGRLFKTDAGYAETQFGAKSVAAITDAAARPITVEPTYWWDFINVDPNSGARWTRTSLNDAKFRLTRNA